MRIIKIIKLIDENKYIVLIGYNYAFYKVIEINKNLQIFISKDKIMKIWELNKEKSLFECFKTIIFQKNIYI